MMDNIAGENLSELIGTNRPQFAVNWGQHSVHHFTESSTTHFHFTVFVENGDNKNGILNFGYFPDLDFSNFSSENIFVPNTCSIDHRVRFDIIKRSYSSSEATFCQLRGTGDLIQPSTVIFLKSFVQRYPHLLLFPEII